MLDFIGREHELERLTELHQQRKPQLVVVKGRRRIGKSRLICEFAERQNNSRLWHFAGLAPEKGVTAQTQRDHFTAQLTSQLNLPIPTFLDWSLALECLSEHLSDEDIILFDEISWMGAGDPSFIPKLKAWWDRCHQPVTLFFCGSISTWIEENILKGTAFFGRINLTLTLPPLTIPESYALLKASGFQGSSYDAYKLLSIFGGIPWYLEQCAAGQTADQMIKQLCFEKDALLVLEFERIFHDLFGEKGITYRKIIDSLKDGMKSLAQVRQDIGFSQSGTLSILMENLIIAGFVEKQQLWSFKTNKPLKQSLYRISDPYMRFYLKCIAPHINKINLNGFIDTCIAQLPGFDAHIGIQLEYLLLQNRALLLKAIGIAPSEVCADGSYRQTRTSKQPGCQIDYLVQTLTKNIFVCEFKFKRKEIDADILNQMQEKLKALSIPRGFASIPVLFHLSGVTPQVETQHYFYRVVDISDFLQL